MQPYICPHCWPEGEPRPARIPASCPACRDVVSLCCPSCQCEMCQDPAVQAIMARLWIEAVADLADEKRQDRS